MEKIRSEACRECPWRRAAAPGWLGGHAADDFAAAARGDHPIVCHLKQSEQCFGAAKVRRNICKMPRHAASLPEGDRENFFASLQEFTDHHQHVSKQ